VSVPELLAGARPRAYPTCEAVVSPTGSASVTVSDRQFLPKCSRPAGYGTAHLGYGPCSSHTGNTAVVRKKFALEAGQHFIAQYKAERVVFGGDPDDINITPEQALMEEVRRSVAMVRFIQSQIATWNPALGDLGALPALTDETTKGQGTPTDAAEWLRLYRDERAHMVRVSKMTIDAGVSMAMVTLAQQQGTLVASAVREILDSLALSPAQAQMVPTIVPEILSRYAKVIPGESYDLSQVTLTEAVLE
jgi:hypothetical protein